MFEDRFEDMLRQFPEAVSEKKTFSALLKDFFPENPMQVNLINTSFDLGIANELSSATHISNAMAFRFVKRLMDEYGVSRIHADWAVSLWCVCYGSRILHKSCDIEISKGQSGAAPAICDERGSGSRQYNDLFQYRAVPEGHGICGFTGDNVRTLIFPNSHNGRPVTRILEGAFEGCAVREAVMTSGITMVESGAFRDCRDLKQVIFPDSLEKIGDAVFSGCRNLVTAALPHSLTQIGSYAFADTALRQLELPQKLLRLGVGAYMGCSKLAAVRLPDHLSELPDKFLKNCSSLRKLTLPDGLQRIGEETFWGCSSMFDLIVPESVTEVGENAFMGMSSSFTIICTKSSAAEQYARKHNVPFQIVL